MVVESVDTEDSTASGSSSGDDKLSSFDDDFKNESGSESSGFSSFEGGGKDDDRRRRLLAKSFAEKMGFDESKSLEDRIKIDIYSHKKLDDETAAELEKFTWKIVSVDPNSLQLKIVFEHPEVVSKDRENPQYVQVKAEFSDFEPGWNNDLVLINVKLP